MRYSSCYVIISFGCHEMINSAVTGIRTAICQTTVRAQTQYIMGNTLMRPLSYHDEKVTCKEL